MFLRNLKQCSCQKKKRGFTLLEVLLVVAIVSAIAAGGAPLYFSFKARNDLALSSTAAASMLRRAQAFSHGGASDGAWGVSVQSGQIVLFQGNSYATRDAGFDDVYELAGTIAPSGTTEFVFDRLSGRPQATGSITLDSTTGDSVVITVNDWGAVIY